MGAVLISDSVSLHGKIKVMFLIPRLSEGGAERVLSRLSCYLPRNIEQVIVIYDNKVSYNYNARLISVDCFVSCRSIVKKIYYYIKRAARIRKVIKSESPACCVSFTESTNFFNALFGVRPVLTVHAYLSGGQSIRSKIINKIVIPCLYRNLHVVTVSNGVKNDLVENYHVKKDIISVINNPIDIREIVKLSNERVNDVLFTNDVPIIVTCGGMREEKGQWHLIRAFHSLRKRIECRLVFLGKGQLMPYLKELTCDLGLENDISFLGWKKNPFKYFSKADVFVLGSLCEGFGNVLIEAMACNIPVVSTDCPSGPREILAPDNGNNDISCIEYASYGILVPAFDGRLYSATDPITDDENMMADALHEIITDRKLSSHYADIGQMRAHDFDVSKIVKQYLTLISETCSSGSKKQ